MMTIRQPTTEEIREWEDVLLLEPRSEYDDCIVGLVSRFNDLFVLYSKKAVIEKLVKDGEDLESALEHWSFNMNGGWYGDGTWGFLEDLEL